MRSIALDAILRNYPALLEAFERISSSSYGVLTQLGKFSVFFGLKLSHLVFGGTEQVSIALSHGRERTVRLKCFTVCVSMPVES